MQVIVLAHGKAQDTFDRHLPFWKSHGLPITVFTPADDPVRQGDFCSIHCGLASRGGQHAATRFAQVIVNVAHSEHDVSVIFSPDSICLLGKDIVPRRGLHGILQPNDDPRRFMTSRYVCPPWMLDGFSAGKMASVATAYPDVYEEGEADRLISAWASLAGVPILNFQELAFSQNTILPPYSTLPGLPKAQWVHGIKSKECLDFVLSQCKS